MARCKLAKEWRNYGRSRVARTRTRDMKSDRFPRRRIDIRSCRNLFKHSDADCSPVELVKRRFGIGVAFGPGTDRRQVQAGPCRVPAYMTKIPADLALSCRGSMLFSVAVRRGSWRTSAPKRRCTRERLHRRLMPVPQKDMHLRSFFAIARPGDFSRDGFLNAHNWAAPCNHGGIGGTGARVGAPVLRAWTSLTGQPGSKI
jgi:hypothetical protein